jgi:hypothetical protein
MGCNFFHGYGDARVPLAFRKRIATANGWVALGRFTSHIMDGIGTNWQGKWGLFVDCIYLASAFIVDSFSLGHTFLTAFRPKSVMSLHAHILCIGLGHLYTWQGDTCRLTARGTSKDVLGTV